MPRLQLCDQRSHSSTTRELWQQRQSLAKGQLPSALRAILPHLGSPLPRFGGKCMGRAIINRVALIHHLRPNMKSVSKLNKTVTGFAVTKETTPLEGESHKQKNSGY